MLHYKPSLLFFNGVIVQFSFFTVLFKSILIDELRGQCTASSCLGLFPLL